MNIEPPDGAALYDTWFPRLRAIAIERFGIAAEEADRLAQDVLLSMLVMVPPAEEPGQWLEATMISACSRYAGREG